jgi:GT2 family glycosyltransferase
MIQHPTVFIIILNWNGLEDTLECLGSIDTLLYGNYRVIVVDNGSSDGSAPIIRRKHPSVTIIENSENLGFTGGNNIGMRYAMEKGADYIWLLNNDTVVADDTLKELVDYAEKYKEAGLLSPYIYFYDSPEMIQFRGSTVDWNNFDIKKLNTENDHDLSGRDTDMVLWGTALFIRRSTIETIGYLDEKYFAYYEDEDYCLRALKNGLGCGVVPGAKVYHKDSRSTGGYTAPMQVFLRSRNYYFLWMDKLKDLEKGKYFFRSVANTISYGGYLKEKNLQESMEACVDGLWSGIKGVGGRIDGKVNMPGPLKFLFIRIYFRNSYFWACLFLGEINNIVKKLRSSGKGKLLQ